MARADDFISASGITDPKFIKSAKGLFADLINFGFIQSVYPSQNISLDKIVALYPRSGGTSTSNNMNCINPAKFNLTQSGGYTHAFDGSTPDGTTGYCDTGINMLNELPNYNITIAYLAMTNIAPGSSENRFPFGVIQGTTQQSLNFYSTNNIQAFSTGSAQQSVGSVSNYKKMYGVIRLNDSLMSLYGDNAKLATDNTTLTIDRHADANLYLDALNNGGTAAYFNNNKCGAFAVANGMTDNEWKIFINLIASFKAGLI